MATRPRHGYLAEQPDAPSTLAKVTFDGSFPTRREEYGFLYNELLELEPGAAMDAGCGYNPAIHVAPYIPANMGWHVEAIDTDLAHFALPWHAGVRRSFGSLAATPFPDSVFDLVYSISTLEHVSPDTLQRFVKEAFRLLKPEGILVLTMDDVDAEEFARIFSGVFDVGELEPEPETLTTPRVAYLVARSIKK